MRNKNGSRRKTGSKKQIRNKNRQNSTRWPRLRAFLFDSTYQVITWVCIAGSFVAIGYFLSKDNMRGTYWSGIVLGIFVILMIAMLGDRHFFQGQTSAKPLKFSVAWEQGIAYPRTSGTKVNGVLWLLYQIGKKTVISPINDLQYIRVTNDPTSAPLLIEFYVFEVRVKGKPWARATTFALNDLENGKLYLIPNEGPTKAWEIILATPNFETAITNRNIAAGESTRGLALLERPAGYDDVDSREWRLLIEDADGHKGTAQISSPIPRKEWGVTNMKWVTGEEKDVSTATFSFYSERSKLE